MSEVLYEVTDPVATITLNRPERLNAFTNQMLRDMREAFDAAAIDPDVVGIVVAANGRGFCAGLDAETLRQVAGEGNIESVPSSQERKGLFSYLTQIPKPVIAAVNGVAAGGGYVLATMADLRFGGPQARFTTVFSKRGVIGEHGVTWTTPRLVGTGRALDLLWSSRMVDADEAYRIGLLEYLVTDPVAEAQDYIRNLAGTVSPKTIADNKRMVWEHAGMSVDDSLDDMWEVLLAQFDSPDVAEGAAAFVEKRPPEFPRLQSD